LFIIRKIKPKNSFKCFYKNNPKKALNPSISYNYLRFMPHPKKRSSMQKLGIKVARGVIGTAFDHFPGVGKPRARRMPRRSRLP